MPTVFQLARDPSLRVELEHAFHARAGGTLANRILGRLLAAEQTQAADDERLSRAGLAREDVQAPAEGDAQLGNESEVADRELDEHALRLPGMRQMAWRLAASPIGSPRSLRARDARSRPR